MDRKKAFHLIDVTDILRHFLATKELGGIPRLVVTIIRHHTAWENLRFCIFLESERRFLVIGNMRSLDVTLLDQATFPRNTDNLGSWIERFQPDLRPVEIELPAGFTPHFIFLSTQWDTLPAENDNAFLRDLIKREKTTFLHHDSYLLSRMSGSPAVKRFTDYWRAVVESHGRTIFISEHTRNAFENHFGSCPNSVTSRYDFDFAYPRVTAGVTSEAINLAMAQKPYLLVFSILDGRKSPIELLENLTSSGQREQFEIALIVRFTTDDKPERIRLLNQVIEHGLHVFYSPNDATYLWLIRNAHAVFYPSPLEGFGMVPIDCKRFGKTCFIPSDADYLYLHDNALTYDRQPIVIPTHMSPTAHHLARFNESKFAAQLFAEHPCPPSSPEAPTRAAARILGKS